MCVDVVCVEVVVVCNVLCGVVFVYFELFLVFDVF